MVILCCFSCRETEVQEPQAIEEESYIYTVENRSKGYAGMSRMFATDSLLYMSWVEQVDTLAILKYATLDGTSWSAAETIAQGTDWFVNWADFPQIAVNNGYVFTHYLQKSAPDTYAYDIVFKIKNPTTGLWSEPRKLHTDSTQSEHGFVSVVPYKSGFMASWLDGRTTVNRPDSLRQMTVRAGIINTDGTLGQQWELDDRVCDCCNTDIANTPDGPVVVYRDRSEDEVRDISIVRMINEESWSIPETVHNDNWKIHGCPVNGPAVTMAGDQLAVAWFTAANNEPEVRLSYSINSSQEFGLAYPVNRGEAIGRVDVASDTLGNTYTICVDDNGLSSSLNLNAKSYEESTIINTQLTYFSAERASGFPQIAVFKDYLYISYTETDQESSDIKMIRIPLNQVEFLKRT